MGENRILNQKFMDALNPGGILHCILQRTLDDTTLDFQIRSNEVHIYYRGGKILGLKKSRDAFSCHFDRKYIKDQNTEVKFPPKIESKEHALEVVRALPELKQVMDFFFARHKDASEREFQQLIVRENNYSLLSNSTDYFIVDIEYATKGARFDLLAIRWESSGSLRKKAGVIKVPPRLALCELKYYTKALEGKSGLVDHVKAISKFFSDKSNIESLKEEVINIFRQKRDLKLVKFGAGGNKNTIDKLDDTVELILMLSNYDPECTNLLKALDEIETIALPEGLELKFATANYLGYGLYKECIYDIDTFRATFRKQIHCNNKEVK